VTQHLRLGNAELIVVEDLRALIAGGLSYRAAGVALAHFHGQPFTEYQAKRLCAKHGIRTARSFLSPFVGAA
jgi:hypothetical protein